MRLFRKLIAGHFRRHRLEAALCLIGVALGVAVVIGIDAAVAACVRSFGGAVESLAERSTHSIFSATGPILDETFIQLARKKLPYPLAPVIDRGVLAGKPSGASAAQPVVARLIGVDVFSERSMRSFTRVQTALDETAFREFMTEPGQVVIVDALADRLGLGHGDAMELTIGSRRVMVRIAGVIKPAGVTRTQLTDVIIADLATAQELTDSLGAIDRIDTSLENAEEEKSLAPLLPAGLSLRPTRQQATSLNDLIGAYRLNLNALSLMASFVAVFIVYNSMLISVQQRLTSLGILRCLGALPRQLAGIYVVEAVLIAIIGGTLGVIGGWGLSRVLVGFVSTTINDLYAAVRPGPVRLDAAMFAKGMIVSIASCLVGAGVPLYRASKTPPINAFRSTETSRAAGGAATKLLYLGLLLLAGAGAAYLLPGRSPNAGFAMALLLALGFALMCPYLTRVISTMIARAARPLQLLPLQMAGSGISRSLGVTGIAVASMMLAMAMNVGVRTMVSSFRAALGHWMDQRFIADVFVGPELLVNHKIDATLDPKVAAFIRAQPQTRQIVEQRIRSIDFADKPITLVATNIAQVLGTLPIKRSLIGKRAFDPKRDALISEPLAGRTQLNLGDSLDVPTPSGTRRFAIYAIFFDFGSERGQIMLDRDTYAAAWRDDRVNSLHITLAPEFRPEDVAPLWSAQLRRDYPVVVNSFRGVKAEVLAVFDRTFKVTEVLTWLAAGVAFCGLAGSLLALAMARRRDYSVLAAVGMSGGQAIEWVLGQGLMIAWISTAIACVAGTVLAYVLSYVIQYRSFGWSIPTNPQPRFWVENFALATLATLMAAIYPVYRLRSVPPAGYLREE